MSDDSKEAGQDKRQHEGDDVEEEEEEILPENGIVENLTPEEGTVTEEQNEN